MYEYQSHDVPGKWYAVLTDSPAHGQRVVAGPFDTQEQAAAWRASARTSGGFVYRVERPTVRVVRGATVTASMR